jgi:dienelactone hydrolase
MAYTFHSYKWKYIGIVVLMICFSIVNVTAQTTNLTGVDSAFKRPVPMAIYYSSDSLKLKGYLYKPEGKGPFPIYMWNHGSVKTPDYDEQQASFWVKNGYIFFMPIRSGQGDNSGPYICDEEKNIKRRKEMEQVQWRQIYKLHKKANEDVVAALKWIKQQPYSDSNNIVVAGGGYGGIQALLIAEKNITGVKCIITMAPASTIWNMMWSDSLTQAINQSKMPILLLEAKNDYNLNPYKTLDAVLTKKGIPNNFKIFPDQGEFSNKVDAWRKEALKYLKECGVKGKK